jgi:ribosome biogenesis GTPase / thiamine phosphate phosphatase
MIGSLLRSLHPKNFITMSTLKQFGWSDIHHTYINNSPYRDLSPGRVVSVRGFKYFLATENGEIETELSGKLMFSTVNEDLPKVGDWVMFMDYGSLGYIIDVMPRLNEVSRKNPGNKTEKQVLAANIDYAMIVQGLDRDFNIMRIERYVVQMLNCRIEPLIILNKVDLVPDVSAYRDEVQKLQRDIEVHFCSTYSGAGIQNLITDVLKPFKTYILLGSSGVGKSSLLNAFTASSLQKVNTTSDSTAKGKHTTTTRDLFLLPNGSLLIDSPGMREFGVTSAEGISNEEMFPAIEKYAGDCRFANCTHQHENCCAVLEALNSGNLSRELYESYLKLVKEQKRFEINVEDKKRLGKLAGRMAREANQHRKKNKF